MDASLKVDLLLIKKYLENADAIAAKLPKNTSSYGDPNSVIRRHLSASLLQVNMALREDT